MESLKGQLLIASPDLADPNFAKSVSLIIQHDADGAMGLVLNQPTELTVKAAWEQVDLGPCEAQGLIFQGGPCKGPLMVLHTEAEASQVEVVSGIPGVHFSAETDKVAWLVARGPERAKFVVGYAGWSPGQLEAEFAQDSWLTLPATAELVFGAVQNAEQYWSAVMAIRRWSALGVRSLRPGLIPPDPALN